MEFKNLGLAEPIVRAVTREGYTVPTPIQAQAIPHVLAGGDLLGCAHTGTGKTAAFALPIIHRLNETSNRPRAHTPKAGANRSPRALILAPTRELASQIGESFRIYGRGLHLTHAVISGGVSQNPQVRAIRAGVDILIATPGRLMDLMSQRHIDLRGIEILVLDEADRMLDMGFIHDIRKIVACIAKNGGNRQTLMFSATMPAEIRALAATILHEPVSVQVDPVASTVKTIAQSLYFVPKKNKPALLKAMLGGEASGRTLVFTRTKHGADKVVKELTKSGILAAAMHGNKTQNARTRALTAFKSKSPPVLIATDVASRGIDVDDITHVINFDMPVDAESYVHRIGRTARAGASGAAVSFCDPDERGQLRSIERLIGEKIAVRSDQPEHAFDAPSHGREESPVQRNGSGGRAIRREGTHEGRRSNNRRGRYNSDTPGPAPRAMRESGRRRTEGPAAATSDTPRPSDRKKRRFGGQFSKSKAGSRSR